MGLTLENIRVASAYPFETTGKIFPSMIPVKESRMYFESKGVIADKIRDVATQKIVISIANPLLGNISSLSAETRASAAEELQRWLPHSKVVKVFNTTFSADFEQPVIDGTKADSFIAGNDKEALKYVAEFVEVVGFNPVIIDDLVFSRTLEQMHLLLKKLLIKNDCQQSAGWKILLN